MKGGKMMSDILKEVMSKNIKKYLKQKGITQTDMAKDLNIPEMTVSNWINAKTYPRPDKIQLMADYFNVLRSDLIEEKSDMPPNVYYVDNNLEYIPILGNIACGEPIYVRENFEGYRAEPKETLPSGNIYYLQAKGDSMEPTIPNGSMVLIREQPDVESNEIAAVLVNGDTEATLKRVRKQKDSVVLMPDNPKYSPIIINSENPARIIGKAIRYTKDF